MVSISSSFKKSSLNSSKFSLYEWFSLFILIGWMMVLVSVTIASRSVSPAFPSQKEQQALVKKIQISRLKKTTKNRLRSSKKKLKRKEEK